jgi:hypothetical protein
MSLPRQIHGLFIEKYKDVRIIHNCCHLLQMVTVYGVVMQLYNWQYLHEANLNLELEGDSAIMGCYA